MKLQTKNKIHEMSLLQSRTPALVFEHVNNTDFKVGTHYDFYSVTHFIVIYFILLSWHTRCFTIHVCVCDGGIG